MKVIELIEKFKIDGIRVIVDIINDYDLHLNVNINKFREEGAEKYIEKFGGHRVIEFYYDGILKIYAKKDKNYLTYNK